MNWLIFALFAFVTLVLDVGLRPLWAVPDAAAGVSPCLLLVLMTFIAMRAPSAAALWAGLVLGLLVDLQIGPAGLVMGPAALGFLAGAYAVLQVRTLVFRQSVATLAVITFVAGIFVHLVSVALYTARGLPFTPAEFITGWDAAEQLVHRFLELLYTCAVAVPFGWLLLRLANLWGFPAGGRR